MSFSRFVAVAGVVAGFTGLFGLTGCASSDAAQKEDAESYESELRVTGARYLGQIANGESKTSYYYSPPNYRAYGFYAKGGDEITVDVQSLYGDGMGWITTSGYTVLAANDDASRATLDAKVVYTVPAGTASRAYRIVFRDYDLLEATFTVKLSIKSATPAPVTCTYAGATHNPGDSFPANDECNTCTCSPNGDVACTEVACVCNPEAEPWRNYIGTPTTCQTIRYACTADKRSFQNACGCGCEALTH